MRDAAPNANALIKEARRWIGVRWRHQGRDFERGVDCAGLLICVAARLGLNLVDRRSYGRRQSGALLMQDLHEQLKYISVSYYNNGDIGVFSEKGYPVHLGFLVRSKGQNSVIHAHARRRRVVEEALDQVGSPIAVFRLPEVS
jgi:cell wall-associated NlpC family hydrolase